MFEYAFERNLILTNFYGNKAMRETLIYSFIIVTYYFSEAMKYLYFTIMQHSDAIESYFIKTKNSNLYTSISSQETEK